jgi:hypothetical protein
VRALADPSSRRLAGTPILINAFHKPGASSKIAAVTIGVFGLVYHSMLAALLFGTIATTDIESWFLSVSGLLLIVVVAMIFSFKGAMNSNVQQTDSLSH